MNRNPSSSRRPRSPGVQGPRSGRRRGPGQRRSRRTRAWCWGRGRPPRRTRSRRAARHGPADRAELVGDAVAGQHGHPRGRLGLAVHDEEPAADGGHPLGEVRDQLGPQPAAGLGQRPQRGVLGRVEAQPAQHLVLVRHRRQAGHAVLGDRGPEVTLQDAGPFQNDRGAPGQMAHQDGQTISVEERQCGHRDVVGGDAEALRDGLRVRPHGRPGQPDQLRIAGRTARGQQQRQLRVRRRGRALPHPGVTVGAVTLRGRLVEPGHQHRLETRHQIAQRGPVQLRVQQRDRPPGPQRAQIAGDRRNLGRRQREDDSGRQRREGGRRLVDLLLAQGGAGGRVDHGHSVSPPSTPST